MGHGTPPDTVIRASLIWDGTSEGPVSDVDVRVRAGTVTELGRSLDAPDAEVVELPGHTLLPGLIDCHVHVVEESLDTEPLAYQVARTVPTLRTLLMRGFTTVRDLGCADQPINVSLKRAVKEGLFPGPRLVVAPNMLSAHGGHGDKTPHLSDRYDLEVGTLADGPSAIARAVRAQARSGADWIKFAASGGFTSPSDTPTDVGYTQAEMTALVAAATDRGLPVAAHAFTDEAVSRAVRAGVRSIEHGCLAGHETLDLIAQYEAYLVPTLYAQLQFVQRLDDDDFWPDQPPTSRAAYREFAAHLVEGVRRPAASRAKVVFGTDAGVFPHDQSWQEFPTMVSNGFTPRQALRAATVGAAELLDRPGLGHIAPGTVGDLVAVPGNPFEDIHLMGKVDFVMQGGRLVRHPTRCPHSP